jgi:hypothetical protein
LPDPDRPTSAVVRPGGMVSDVGRKAGTAPPS